MSLEMPLNIWIGLIILNNWNRFGKEYCQLDTRTRPFFCCLMLLLLFVSGCDQDKPASPEDKEIKRGPIAFVKEVASGAKKHVAGLFKREKTSSPSMTDATDNREKKGIISRIRMRIESLFDRQKTSPPETSEVLDHQEKWRTITINFNFQNYDNKGKFLGTIDDVRVTISADSDDIEDISSQLRSGSALKVEAPKNFSGNLTISAEKENYRLEPSIDVLTITENDNDYTVIAQFQKHQREMRTVSVRFEFQSYREDGKYLGTLDGVKVTVSSNVDRKSLRLKNKDVLPLQVPLAFAGNIKIQAVKSNYQLRQSIKPLLVKPDTAEYSVAIQFEEPPPIYRFTFTFFARDMPIEGGWVELLSRGDNKDNKTVKSIKSDVNGKLRIDMPGYVNDRLQITAHHDAFAVPVVNPYKLTEEKSPTISLEMPTFTLNILSRTSDGGRITRPITIITQTTESQVELGPRLETRLGKTTSMKILKPVNGKLEIIGQIKDNSKYDDAILIYQLSENNQVTLEFSPSTPFVIQILCRDKEENPLEGVTLKVGTDGDFVEQGNGSYIHQGHARDGRQVNVAAKKEGYIFENLPPFTVRSNQKIQKTIYGQLGQINLTFTALEEKTNAPIGDVTLRVKNQTAKTNRSGIATLQIPPEIEVTIPLEIVSLQGFEGPYWQSPSDTNNLRITENRSYNLKALFRRLPRLVLKIMDARNVSKTIAGTKLLGPDTNVLGTTGADGLLRVYFPKSTGRFQAKLSAEGYLEEEYNIKVPTDTDEYSDTRHLLPVSPLVYRMGFGEVELEIGLNSSLMGEKQEQEKLKQRITNTLMRQLNAVNTFTSVGQIASVNLDHPNWHQSLHADYFTVATLNDLGSISNRRLTVDIYDVKVNKIEVSAFVEQFELFDLQSKIQTRIVPQLLATLPVVGYVVGYNKTGVVLNIGHEQSINSGDVFSVDNLKRDPQGKVISEEKIDKLQILKESVKRSNSVLVYSSSNQIGLGSLATRQPLSGRLATLHGVPGAKVYWKSEGTEAWQFAGTANNAGDIEFEVTQEAFTTRLLDTGSEAEKSYRQGTAKIDDEIQLETSYYTLTVETTPPNCSVKIYGGIGKTAKWLNDGISGEDWQCTAGSYKIEVVTPDKNYKNKTAVGLVPIPSATTWDGAERSLMTSKKQATITIHLPPDYLAQIENAEKEGKSPAKIVQIASNIKTDDPDYRSCMLKVGKHAQKIPNIEKAIEAYRGIIQINHRDPFAYYKLGEVYSRSDVKNHEEAVTAYQEASKYLGEMASTSSRLLLEHNVRLGVATAYYHQGEVSKLRAAFLTYEDLYNRLEKDFMKSDNPAGFAEHKTFFDTSYQNLKNLIVP